MLLKSTYLLCCTKMPNGSTFSPLVHHWQALLSPALYLYTDVCRMFVERNHTFTDMQYTAFYR